MPASILYFLDGGEDDRVVLDQNWRGKEKIEWLKVA